jgi:hypothetical protein
VQSSPIEIKRTGNEKRVVRTRKDARSIDVVRPARGEFLAQGEPMDILWQVSGDLATDCMKISLLLRRSAGSPLELSHPISTQYRDSMQGHSTYYQRSHSWNVPPVPSMQGPIYFVRVETCDGTVIGDSAGFFFPGMNPEFSVNRLRSSPAVPRASVPVEIRADIVNMGGIGSQDSSNFTLELLVKNADDEPIIEKTFDSAALGAPPLGFTGRYQFKYPFTPDSEGVHRAYLTVQSYPGGEVMDPFQGNNSDTHMFTVEPPLPDLVVCMKKRNHVRPPGSFTFPVTVKNIGHAESAPTRLKFWVSGNGSRHYDVRALQPGESARPQRTLYWGPLVAGRNTFEVFVDESEQIPKLRNDNNNLLGLIVKGKYGSSSEIICSDHPDAGIPIY